MYVFDVLHSPEFFFCRVWFFLHVCSIMHFILFYVYIYLCVYICLYFLYWIMYISLCFKYYMFYMQVCFFTKTCCTLILDVLHILFKKQKKRKRGQRKKKKRPDNGKSGVKLWLCYQFKTPGSISRPYFEDQIPSRKKTLFWIWCTF